MSRRQPPYFGLTRVALTDLLLVVILLLLIMRFLLPLLLGGLLGVGQPGSPNMGLLGMVTVLLMMIQAAVMLGLLSAFILKPHGLGWADLGLYRPQQPWLLHALLMGLFCTVLAAVSNALLQHVMGQPLENPQIQAIAPTVATPLTAILMLLTGSIIVPIAEEIAFRGLLYRWLRIRLAVMPAVLLSALCFAALHGVPALVPSLTLIGIVLALATERSGSVWPAIVIHGVFNFIMMMGLFFALTQGLPLSDN